MNFHNRSHRQADRILRLPEVLAITGVSQSTILRWERAGDFPPRVQIGTRSVGWRSSDIARWLDSRCAAASGLSEMTSADQV